MKTGADTDTQEILEDMAEDLAKSRGNDPLFRRQKNSYGSGPSGKFILILGLGAVILILLLVLLLRGSDKQDLTPIQSRLDQLEKRTPLVDEYGKRIEALENQMKSLQQSQSRLEGSGKSMAERLDKLSRQVEKPQAQPSAQKEPVKAKAQAHEVRPGDTLFSIASKYGITLDQLLRLNNMKKNAAIQPGQKLLIAPENP
jgi:LysM repeat protein